MNLFIGGLLIGFALGGAVAAALIPANKMPTIRQRKLKLVRGGRR